MRVNWGYPPPGGSKAVQDGLGIVLIQPLFRLTVWVRFFEPLGCLLESFSGALGVILGHLGSSWVRFWALRMAF